MTDHDRAAARPEIAVNRAAAVEAGSPAGSLQDEVHLGESRIDAEDVVWLVAVAATQKVGIVFGELAGGRSECEGVDPPRPSEEGPWHRCAALDTFGDLRILPRRAGGGPHTRRRAVTTLTCE